MTVRKDFMLCHTGHGLAATRRPFGDAHHPVGHSTRTRISSHYQTTQHKNKVSTLSGDLTVPMIALTIAAFWFLLPSLEIPSWMRTVTFPIYVLHQMVLYVLLIPLRFIDFGISSCSINIALLLITIMLSVVIAKLINRYTPRISLIIFGGRV